METEILQLLKREIRAVQQDKVDMLDNQSSIRLLS